MSHFSWFALGCFLVSLSLAAAQDLQVGRPVAQSLVPAWDLRGPLNPPWQGIACVAMTPDGRFVAVGTTAPYGDPNAFLLDEQGQIADSKVVRMRWVIEVVVGPGGAWWGALTGLPQARPGDPPRLNLWAGGKEVAVPEDVPGRLLRFAYGDHSNHLTHLTQAAGDRLGLTSEGANGVVWLKPDQEGERAVSPVGAAGVYPVTAWAANAKGRAVVGRALNVPLLPRYLAGTRQVVPVTENSRDLLLLDMGAPEPLWGRSPTTDAEAPPALERALLGAPAPPYEDVKVYCPLAVAIDAAGTRFASADYQGWDRVFAARGDDDLRFMPSRPTIQVYDSSGNALRRFGPESFREPFWCDLAFLPDSDLLLAFPRSWACRGLAGRGFLPVDEKARTLYALSVDTGQTRTLSFPDAIASVAVSRDLTVVACWDRRVYFLDHSLRPMRGLEEGLEVGDAALVRVSEDGKRVLVAGGDGMVRMLDGQGKELWRTDLNKAATPGEKPWLAQQRSGVVGPGVWSKSGGFTESDMGGQYYVQAPEGLLLIDPNAGVSIEANMAGMRAAGLDPMQVKYVLLTHEHGDHAPGAYLWRVLTGAQVVGSPEMAYMLRYRPQASDYGFHPPQVVDIQVSEDTTLDLAGLKVTCVRTPGHTYGSMSYVFDLEGQRYCALGDLIMPGGAPGYSGSLDFSAAAMLASLRKLEALKPTFIIGGHGGGDPDNFLAAGVGAGVATGWGMIPPEKPEPLFGFRNKNYLPVACGERISTAGWGDVEGDGRPDVVVATRRSEPGAALKVYLNQGGKFGTEPNLTLPLPEAVAWVRVLRLGEGKFADLFAASEGTAILFRAQGDKPDYQAVPLPGLTRATQVLVTDLDGDGRRDLVVGGWFIGNAYWLCLQQADGSFQVKSGQGLTAPYYFNLALADVNGDGREDLISSEGEILLRQADGTFPAEPSLRLKPPGPSWNLLAVGDFTGDKRPDVVFMDGRTEQGKSHVWCYYHTGDTGKPYPDEPQKFVIPVSTDPRPGCTVADWDGDGIADIIPYNQGEAAVLLGSPQGLGPDRLVRIPLDYTPAVDSPLGAFDYDGDGKLDLAGWGYSPVRAQGVYIYLQR